MAPDFLRTHPVTLSRIADARARVAMYADRKRLDKARDDLQFYLMREKLRVMMASDLLQLKGYYSDKLKLANQGSKETVIRYGYSLALIASGDYIEARKMLSSLVNQDSERLSYQLALAKIEIAVGQLGAALAIYQNNQMLYPDDRVLTLEQVDALLLANLPRQATSLLLRQLELGNQSGKLYKLLAQAKSDMGESGQSHSWLAEYYYHAGRLEQAMDQLHLAMSYAQDEYQMAKINARLRDIKSAWMQMEKTNGK